MKPELVRIALRHLPCTRTELASAMGYANDVISPLVAAMIQNGYALAQPNGGGAETIVATGKTLSEGSKSAACAQLFLLMRKEVSFLSSQQTRLRKGTIGTRQYADSLARMDRRLENFIEANFK